VMGQTSAGQYLNRHGLRDGATNGMHDCECRSRWSVHSAETLREQNEDGRTHRRAVRSISESSAQTPRRAGLDRRKSK
jgi:hypothetical protein